MEVFYAKSARFYFKTITVTAMWRIYCSRARSVKARYLLLMQVRNEDGLNRVSSKGAGVARSGIHFKVRVARISREWLTSDHFLLSFSVLDLIIYFPS